MERQKLQLTDITSLFVAIDDLIKSEEKKLGRPTVVADSEVVTMLIWCTLILKLKNLHGIYNFVGIYHQKDFPKLPNYQNFIKHCHRCLPLLSQLLEISFDQTAKLRFVDSTMLPVCKKVRADKHKVAQSVAAWGKNWQGWHYGFKLHATVSISGQLCALRFTPANEHDAQQLPYLIRGAKVVVGDGGYNARIMREYLWKEFGVFTLAPPHPTQKKKVFADWQKLLLRARPKIEAGFDILKEHFYLVSSFPRSVKVFLLHYLRVLIAFQLSLAIN